MMSCSDRLGQMCSFVKSWQKELGVTLVAVVLVAGGLAWNHCSKLAINEAAFVTFEKLGRLTNASVDEGGKTREENGRVFFSSAEKKHLKLLNFCQEAFQNHSKSGLAPLFLANQAEALRQLGEDDKALAIMESAVSLMQSSTTRDLYDVKLCVMRLESVDAAIKAQGLSCLKAMVASSIAPADRFALFRLHEYHWVAKEYSEALSYGSEYLLKYGAPGKNSMPGGTNDSDDLATVKFNMRSMASK